MKKKKRNKNLHETEKFQPTSSIILYSADVYVRRRKRERKKEKEGGGGGGGVEREFMMHSMGTLHNSFAFNVASHVVVVVVVRLQWLKENHFD